LYDEETVKQRPRFIMDCILLLLLYVIKQYMLFGPVWSGVRMPPP
jgi:hypothetical protein